MGQICQHCGFDQESIARERAAEQSELDARLAERLQAEEFELQAEEDAAAAMTPRRAISVTTRGHRRGNQTRGATSWDLLWDSFPLEASDTQPTPPDFGARAAARQQHQQHRGLRGALDQRRAQFQQLQQPQVQQRRRLGSAAQALNQHQVPHFMSPFPGLVIMQQPPQNAGGRPDALGLLSELFGHQHVRDPAALFELLGELEPVPRGVDPAIVDASTTTMIHEASAAERGGSAAQSLCSVCLEHFRQGEELRMLPCMHRYHRQCIDRWLARSPACPVCKHEIAR